MEEDVRTFYESLADDYHLLFEDWWEAALGHGDVVEASLARSGVRAPARILDATCGIGTQALPLAARGFEVTGADLSGRAIGRARDEAATRGLDVDLVACDIRDLPGHVEGPFDAVISFDNALAHLPTHDALVDALVAVGSVLRTDGAFLASLRDYDRLRADGVEGVMPILHRRGEEVWISGQAWEWDAGSVLIHLLVAHTTGGAWRSQVRTTRFRALGRADLEAALARAGYREVAWLEVEESGYYQPIVSAVRRR